DQKGDRGTALALIDEAIVLNTELGTVPDTADLLNRRGDFRLGDDPERAQQDYERAAELSRAVGATDMRANAFRGLGDVARVNGETAAARAHYEAALALSEGDAIGAVEARARALLGSGELALLEGDARIAESHYRAALGLAQDSALN
ncbi:AfsR/SARP family transcriptional regulator, partial [Streptomyces roseolus]